MGVSMGVSSWVEVIWHAGRWQQLAAAAHWLASLIPPRQQGLGPVSQASRMAESFAKSMPFVRFALGYVNYCSMRLVQSTW